MFGLDYKDLYHRIEHQMKERDVSVEMKSALLELEIGLRKVEYVEIKERLVDNLQNMQEKLYEGVYEGMEESGGC